MTTTKMGDRASSAPSADTLCTKSRPSIERSDVRWYSASTMQVSRPLVTNTTSAGDHHTDGRLARRSSPMPQIGPMTPNGRSSNAPAGQRHHHLSRVEQRLLPDRDGPSDRPAACIHRCANMAVEGEPSRTIENANAQPGVTSPPSLELEPGAGLADHQQARRTTRSAANGLARSPGRSTIGGDR